MTFVSEIEAVSLASVFQWDGAIDEKQGVVDIAFLAEFAEERVSNDLSSRRFKLCMQQFVGVRIDSSVQPVALVAELNHGFVHGDVTRASTGLRL